MALAQLKEDYVLLGKSSDQKIQESIAQNNALLKEIALKESALSAREERVDQLEELIALKEAALSELKQRLSDALLNFRGKGLTVEQRNGKVYVSMENKLLFQSGRWDIEAEGKKAIRQLAAVLQDNPDISILIEGHTDNVPFSGQGGLESNWDLSTKRATAVVNILLENDQLLPQNLTAAGRSEYIPIAPNSTPEGRASNRRIEVILSPQWDEINALLNN
jgi:chemotaxis protein MotB